MDYISLFITQVHGTCKNTVLSKDLWSHVLLILCTLYYRLHNVMIAYSASLEMPQKYSNVTMHAHVPFHGSSNEVQQIFVILPFFLLAHVL